MKAAPHESDNAIPMVKKNNVAEILGVVTTDGAVHTGPKGSENSTRWVFDVEVIAPGSLDIQLLNVRNKPAQTDIEPSFHITPLSGSFYDSEARVWGETKKTLLTLHFGCACKFRVDVDIIGTNRR